MNTSLSFDWKQLPLRKALDSLMDWYSESIVFLDKDVEGYTITASCNQCNFEQALQSILNGTSLYWIRRGNQIIILSLPQTSLVQRSALNGFIKDSLTGEQIISASVLLYANSEPGKLIRVCTTNSIGYYSIPELPIGKYRMVVSAIGYEPVDTLIEVRSKICRYSLTMVPRIISIPAITVEGFQSTILSNAFLSHSKYHFSTPIDRNLYLIEGERIYNPVHSGGVLSSFNPEAITNVQRETGGLPVSYGGQVGSIIDATLKEGSHNTIGTALEFGTLHSGFVLDGSLTHTTTSLLAGRIGYPHIAARMFSSEKSSPKNSGTFEVTAKLQHRISSNSILSFNGYWGKDLYKNEENNQNVTLENNFTWENQMANLRWRGLASPSLFFQVLCGITRYSFDLNHRFSPSSFNNIGSSTYSIQDYNIHAYLENYSFRNHLLLAGAEITHHSIAASIDKFTSQIGYYSLKDYSAWESALYLQDQWSLSQNLLAQLGGRFTNFSSSSGTFSAIDPRFSLSAMVTENFTVYSSFSVVNQFLHLYRHSGVFLLYPTIFWYPSDDVQKPSTSLHSTFGISNSLNNGAYRFSGEIYYRVTNNFHEFISNDTLFTSKNITDFLYQGKARTYGLTISAQKQSGSCTGALAYTLSWFKEQFSSFNNGVEFLSPFDRRHEFQGSLSYSFKHGWTVSALCILATKPGTSLVHRSIQYNGSAKELPSDSYAIRGSSGYLMISEQSLYGFKRLDFGIHHSFPLKKIPCEFSLRLMNGYGLFEPFQWNLISNPTNIIWNASLKEQKIFPLYPILEIFARI